MKLSKMKTVFKLLIILLVITSCQKEEINETVSSEVELSLFKQAPNPELDNSKKGLYHGVFSTKDFTMKGKIYISIGNRKKYSAEIRFLNGEKMYFEANNQNLESIYFLNERGSFTYNISDENNPIATDVVVDNKESYISAYKEQSSSRVLMVLGTYTETGNPSFSGNWDFALDQTAMTDGGYATASNFYKIKDVISSSPAGTPFNDTNMTDEDFTNPCDGITYPRAGLRVNPTTDFWGIDQLSVFGGVPSLWNVNHTGSDYYDNTCSVTAGGTWFWNGKQGTFTVSFDDKIAITASNFSTTIDEHQATGTVLGTISASTTVGTLSYTLANETPAGAYAIDPLTGEISIKDTHAFDYEFFGPMTIPAVIADVILDNGSVQETISLTTHLNDLSGVRVVKTLTSLPSGTTDGPLAQASVSRPTDVIEDSNGNLYVASNSYFLRKINTSNVVSTTPGISHNFINSLTIDNVNNIIYVGGSNSIFKYDILANTMTLFSGSGTWGGTGFTNGARLTARYDNVQDIEYDAVNHCLYVVDHANYAIRKIDLITDQVSTYAGGNGLGYTDGFATASAQFNSVYSLALSSSNELFISDGCAIRKIDTAGVPLQVTSFLNNGCAPETEQVGSFAVAKFHNPIEDLEFDSLGNLYASESQAFKISKIDFANSVVTNYAGVHRGFGFVDGLNYNAKFKRNMGFGIRSNGEIIISDYEADVIRSIKAE